MKTKIFLFIFVFFIALTLLSQSLLAQNKSCCSSDQDKTEKSCCGDCQEEKEKKVGKGTQENCPVMGNKVNKKFYTDYMGKRVYFCCSGCIDTFKKDPEKYMKKMKEAGVKLESVPCPISGNPSNHEIFTEHEGEKVYFCCEGCKEKFEKDPKKYLKQEEKKE